MSNSNEINWKKSFYQALFIYILTLIGGAIVGTQIVSGVMTEQEGMKLEKTGHKTLPRNY